jgi:hypothetical protein
MSNYLEHDIFESSGRAHLVLFLCNKTRNKTTSNNLARAGISPSEANFLVKSFREFDAYSCQAKLHTARLTCGSLLTIVAKAALDRYLQLSVTFFKVPEFLAPSRKPFSFIASINIKQSHQQLHKRSVVIMCNRTHCMSRVYN